MIHGNSSKLIPCFCPISLHLFSAGFFSSFISFKSVDTKEMTILYSFLALLTIRQRKGITKWVKASIYIISFIQHAPKLIPCFCTISQILNTSANYQPNQASYGSKSKLAHCKSKTIALLEIKDLVFMLRSIKQLLF